MHCLQLYISNLPNFVFTLASFGGTGVHIFLFCSGFGLYLSYLRRPISFSDFLRRRFIKVYVPYIFVVLISFMTPYMYKSDDKVIALLSHVFLFKMFVPKYESSFGGQLWYISTLFQFYLVFIPLCRIKAKMKSKHFMFVMLFSSILWWLATTIFGLNVERIWASFFLQYLWEFALGMMVAEYLWNKNDIIINSK